MQKLQHNAGEPEFKGYGFDELRYRRAYTLAKYEIAKTQMNESIQSARTKVPFAGRSGILARMLGSLNYLDYALMAFKVVNKIIKFRKSAR